VFSDFSCDPASRGRRNRTCCCLRLTHVTTFRSLVSYNTYGRFWYLSELTRHKTSEYLTNIVCVPSLVFYDVSVFNRVGMVNINILKCPIFHLKIKSLMVIFTLISKLTAHCWNYRSKISYVVCAQDEYNMCGCDVLLIFY